MVPKQYLGIGLLVVAWVLSAIPGRYYFSASKEDAQRTFAYINQLRQQYGRAPLAWDERVYALAVARLNEMNNMHYYDHTNPVTGNCPYKMKSFYGLTENEDVAENIDGYESLPFLHRAVLQPQSDAVRDWLGSRGHRFNLLYENHTSGALACGKDKCVFLGLNHTHFGNRCYTAAEGKAHWKIAPLRPGEVSLPEQPTNPFPQLKPRSWF